MASATEVERELARVASPAKAAVYRRFFKTGPGEYGAGDEFLGVTMPAQRAIAKRYQELDLKDVAILLSSRFHEHRMTGLIILTYQYAGAEKRIGEGPERGTRGSEQKKRAIFQFYLANLRSVNNWDLVDVTVPRIVGAYLYEHPERRRLLYGLVRSRALWERRIAVLATFPFIRNDDFDDILKLCALLLDDQHDLIHKATGWMLREVGKRGVKGERALKGFLAAHVTTMPRTMLRYAIEKFPEQERQTWLAR